jgi:hypothetical protein
MALANSVKRRMRRSRYHLLMPEPVKGKRPARQSWVDVLIAWIERLPGPAWVFYLVVSLLFAATNVGLRWLDGSIPFGVFDPGSIAWGLLTIYGLAFVHFLNGAARRSLEAFRPALGVLEPQYDDLRRRLTSTSPVTAFILLFVGIAFQAIGSSTSPTGWGITSHNSVATNVFSYIQEDILGIFLGVFFFRAIGQLRLIIRIHRESTNINLYESEPHNAFSRFTFPTSVAVTVPYAIAEIVTGTTAGISIFEIGLLVSAFLISTALFVLPLNGMHRRLVQEKAHQVTESDLRFEVLARELHEQVDGHQFEQLDAVNKAMMSLTIESEKLKKISTWPWRPDTLRGFLSSIALPIVLWIITTLLSRYVVP